MRQRLVLALAWGIVITLAGCGVKSYPVKGEVVFPDGKPLTGGTVVFELKTDDLRARTSTPAEIDTEGKFEAKMPAGAYRVMVAPDTPTQGGPEGSERTWKFDPKFSAFETSKLEFSVEADETKNHFKITVTRPEK